jgi:hypothetical protein
MGPPLRRPAGASPYMCLGLAAKYSVAHCSTRFTPGLSANCSSFRILGIHKAKCLYTRMSGVKNTHNPSSQGVRPLCNGMRRHLSCSPSRVPTHVWGTAPISSYLYLMLVAARWQPPKKHPKLFFLVAASLSDCIRFNQPTSSFFFRLTITQPAPIHLEKHVARPFLRHVDPAAADPGQAQTGR